MPVSSGISGSAGSTSGQPQPQPPPQEDDVSTLPASTEYTPLLASETGSHTVRGDDNDAGGSSGGCEGGRNAGGDRPRHEVGPSRAACIAIGICIAILIPTSNASGMTMIQSRIAEDLDAYTSVLWFAGVHFVTASALFPLVGRLASIFSPAVLVPPMAAFMALGGVVSGLAPSLAVFLAGRVLLGLGSAICLSLGVIFVLELVGEKRRGLCLGFLNMCNTVGVSVGAVLYGALEPAVGWRALLWLQAPLALVVGLLLYLGLPASLSNTTTSADKSATTRQKLADLDYPGAFLLISSIFLFLYGLSGDIQPLVILLSLVVCALFVLVEFRVASDPVVPLSVLSSRGVLLSCVAQLAVMSDRWSVLYFTPLLALAVRGFGPVAAGSFLVPTNAAFAVGGIVVGWLHVRRTGAFWTSSLVAVALCAASFLAMAWTTPRDTPTWAVVLAVVANGLSVGATLNYTLVHALHLSRAETHFVVTGFIGTFRGLSGAFGTTIGGGIFYRLLRRELVAGFSRLDGDGGLTEVHAALVPRLMGSPAVVFSGGLNLADRTVAVDSYEAAAMGLWWATVVVGAVAVLAQAGTGWKAPVGREQERWGQGREQERERE